MFILENLDSEAKQVNIKLWIQRSEANVVIAKNQVSEVYIKELKNRSEANVVNIKLWIWRSETNVVIAKNHISEAKRSEANWFILKLYNIEAKRTGSIVILCLKRQKKTNFRFFKKRKAKNESVR